MEKELKLLIERKIEYYKKEQDKLVKEMEKASDGKDYRMQIVMVVSRRDELESLLRLHGKGK